MIELKIVCTDKASGHKWQAYAGREKTSGNIWTSRERAEAEARDIEEVYPRVSAVVLPLAEADAVVEGHR